MFLLRFELSQIRELEKAYLRRRGKREVEKEREIEFEIGPKLSQQGWLSKEDFVKVCSWKARRAQVLLTNNNEEYVRAVLYAATSTTHEKLRIDLLMLLQGVGWPIASVILHFGFPDQYPIWDRGQLWSMHLDRMTPPNFEVWWGYVGACRNLAKQVAVSMRTLDRALCEYATQQGWAG